MGIWVGISRGSVVRGSRNSVNVIGVVQPWVWYGTSGTSQFGAVAEFSVMPYQLYYVGGPGPSFPSGSYACLIKFSTPSLQLVYFCAPARWRKVR
jgi:hypothetical protein